jgi:hypothetical protein
LLVSHTKTTQCPFDVSGWTLFYRKQQPVSGECRGFFAAARNGLEEEAIPKKRTLYKKTAGLSIIKKTGRYDPTTI